MLFVLCQLGTDGYLVEAAQVQAVLPLVELKQIPQAPPGVAGVLDYGGSAIPVIDLSRLATGQSAATRLSTRILLLRYDAGARGPRRLGVLVERVARTMHREPAEFANSGVAGEPWLGPVVPAEGRLLQRLDLQELLPAPLRELLFAEGGPAP